MFRKRVRASVLLLLAAFAVASCGHPAPPRAAVADRFDAPYALDAGDKVRIVVFGQDGISNDYAVDAAGTIAMPLIGNVPVAGLTPAEAQKEIARRLRGGYIRDPQVALEVSAYRPFFILGEVNKAGQYPYVAGMTAQQAAAIAGGQTPRGRTDIVEITRKSGGRLVKATVPVTYAIRPGDSIVVPERFF